MRKSILLCLDWRVRSVQQEQPLHGTKYLYAVDFPLARQLRLTMVLLQSVVVAPQLLIHFSGSSLWDFYVLPDLPSAIAIKCSF